MPASRVSGQQPSLDKVHTRSALTVVALIITAGLLAIPFGSLRLGVNTGFLPAFGSLTFMGDFITALLLFSRARATNDKALACLGSAYLFSAAIIIPHLLAFPGVFGPVSLIGTSASAVWLWVFWHGGFALGVINFALRKPGTSERPRHGRACGVCGFAGDGRGVSVADDLAKRQLRPAGAPWHFAVRPRV
jgi:hypothetical protein